jgi:hypothetical protein
MGQASVSRYYIELLAFSIFVKEFFSDSSGLALVNASIPTY